MSLCTPCDITGQRHGRLVAVRRLQNGKWICQCDCGKQIPLPSALCTKARSCGCLVNRNGVMYARCPACNVFFAVDLTNPPTPQFCPQCAPNHAHRKYKVCAICGKLFSSAPSQKTVCCSKDCSKQWRQFVHIGISNHWSPVSRARASAKGQTDNLKLGSPAAKKSQIAGRFETNQEAKIWHLITPTGDEIVIRNLLKWARENAALFDKTPNNDKSATQIASGFRQISRTLQGKRAKPSMYYFGWTLKCPPELPGK